MNSSKTAFLFPGQGVQTIGMAKELCDNIPECKEILDRSEEILNMPIKKMMFEGPEEIFNSNRKCTTYNTCCITYRVKSTRDKWH